MIQDDGWLEDMASLVFATIIVTALCLLALVGFWLVGWL